MSSKTFGVVVGVIVSLAIAMFVGLYMLGLSGQGHNEQVVDYYDYPAVESDFYYADEPVYTDDGSFYYDEGLGELPLE